MVEYIENLLWISWLIVSGQNISFCQVLRFYMYTSGRRAEPGPNLTDASATLGPRRPSRPS